MAAPVVVRFSVEGVDQVKRAFKTVEDAVVRGESESAKQAQRSSRERVGTAEREARDKQRLMDREQREREKIQKSTERDAERTAQSTLKAAEKAARDAVRAEEAAARVKNQIRERSATMAGRYAEQQANKEIREAQRSADESKRIAEAAARERSRFASTIMGAGIAGARAGASRIGGIASGVAGVALGLGGGFSIADSLQNAQDVNRQAALLSNNAAVKGNTIGKWAGKDAGRADPAKLAAHARAVSLETGVDANELLAGTNLYVKRSSDLGGGMANMGLYAKMAKATGGKFSDFAETAARLRAQADMSGTSMTADQEREMMLSMHQAGKLGSITMDEMAHVAPKITKTRSKYQGDALTNQHQLLGLAQIAAKSGDSPEAAATTVSNLAQDVQKHAGKINAMPGGRIDDAKTGQLIAPTELIAKIFEKSGGNQSKMAAMGINVRSSKLFSELAGTFEAAGGFKDTAKGVAAVRDKMAPLTGAKGDAANLEADFKAVEATLQFERALMELKQTVGEQLLPEFVKLVPTIKEMIPLFVDVTKTALPAFVDFIKSVAQFAEQNKALIHELAANPIGAIMAAEVSKSILAAGLGAAMRKMMETSLGSSGGIAIGTATVAITAAMLTIAKLAADDDATIAGGTGALAKSGNIRGKARAEIESGTLTRGTLDEMKKQQMASEAALKESEAGRGGGTAFKFLAGFGAGVADGVTGGAFNQTGKVVDAQKQREGVDDKAIAAQKAELVKLTQSITAAQKALDKLAASAKNGDPNRGSPQGHGSRGGTQ